MVFEQDKVEDGLFESGDIDMVAAISMYHPIVQATRSTINRMRVNFSFTATADLLQDVEDYQYKRMQVEPKAYYHQLRDIRKQINSILEINKGKI